MHVLRLTALLAICVFLGSGCVSNVSVEPVSSVTSWVSTESGLDVRVVEVGEAGKLRIYRFEKDAFFWRVMHGAPKTVAGWAEELEGEVAVANGVYFHEDMLPSGLLLTDGERVGDRLFDIDKTSVLIFGDAPRIVDTATGEFFESEGVLDAVQSYPLLVKDGKPNITEDSGLTGRRTAFGMDEEGNTYLLMTLESEPSLYVFAEALSSLDIPWDRVVNLDGGPSTGVVLEAHPDVSINSFTAVPNVLVVTPIR